ncbi:tmem1 family protein [Rutstroemia sp. NJR-2017a BBW]|nr:tmem1 family protein [Rutstroemia sp. NJR-2017a BBW]PQE08630.1 tmem1 family protein [Rutstroemia sp. NJR-2017a BBW]
MEEPSSSSKVTVEYFDPYEVYPLFSSGLLPRLPLRNLHWESHAGPLRSISSLHVDLVRSPHDSAPIAATESTSSSAPDLSRVKSTDSGASGDDGFRTQAIGQVIAERPRTISRSSTSKSAAKGRRHQIPGLRQTPYLKIFFLRCDDNDTYKSQGRKQVREWIKEHTPTAASTSKATSQENHDNFEWLIVHVIVPNTAAATQPRTSGKSAESSSGSTSEKSGVRWRGGGSSTILEKLRADFNGSSKSGVDRIAQIRIGINDVPYDMLPRVVPAIPGSYTETPQENENAWIDLISKLKFLILQSFDMRVSQYEEDIRKSDSKRSMPGWNFCTFFVLKEGLARGFESVGLVEDALVGYDELAIGLDTIVGEQAASGSGAEHGGSFLPYTEDLKRRAEQARAAILKEMGVEHDDTDSEEPIDLQSTGESTDKEDDEIPINSAKKRYRELILSNDVSIFDFRCYIFSRQLFLLLRQANAWSTQAELLAKLKEQRESSLLGVAARIPAAQPSDDAEDLALLGEVCKRSMDFAASISSIMREDIWSAYFHSQKDISYEKMKSDIKADPLMAQVIENVVSSFTFSLSQQILAQTSTKALPIPASTLAPPTGSGQEQKAAIPEPKTMMHPARSTSLALRSSSREPPSPGLFPRGRRSSLPGPEPAQSTFLKNGLEELAAHRAELYLLARSVLEHVGKRRGWSTGWEVTKSEHQDDGDMKDISLDDDTPSAEEETAEASLIPPSIHGLDSKLLRTALNDKDNFYRLYETLTDKALRHYTVANRVQSVQTCMADLAILKYHLKDYAGAASYFYRITPFYGDASWTQIEMSMLIMYASCLKELDRKDEYAKVVLKLLARAATIEKDRLSRKSSFKIGPNRRFDWEEITLDDTYLDVLLEITKALPRDIHVPLQDYFSQLEVVDTLQYHESKDSFGLQLRLHYLLKNNLKIDKARVRIAPLVGIPGREIWLESGEEILLKKGWTKFQVQTNVTIPSTYQVTHVILHSSKLIFEYPYDNSRHSSATGDSFFKCPKLLVYHRAEAFNAKLFASKCMHLDRNRSLEIELSSGWNKVNVGQLHVRAATAGLRLQTSEAKVIDGEVDLPKKAEAGVVHFGAMEPESTVRLSIPFNLEHEVNDITLKLELSYTTDQGDFFFATPSTVSILLPLGVNVQDVFKHTALFSKFTISTSTNIPLRLLSSKLERSEVFEAQTGPGITKPVTIFLRQPATMLYKITKALSPLSPTSRRKSQKSSKTSLSLVLNYMCLDEEVNDAVAQALEEFLKNNILRPYKRLIIPTVLAELRTHFLPYDFERAAVLGEIPTSFILNIKWRDNFSGLGKSVDPERDTTVVIEQSLREWQQKTPSISLPTLSIDEDAISKSRSIVIPVDVPSVNVVHTADLRLLQRASVSTNSAVAAANEPIPVSLHLKSTRAWDTEASLPDSQGEDLEFMYEVSGHSDTWLIGGRRKGHFKVPGSVEGKGKKSTFPVVLIPLREGFLPFPTVEIKPSPVVKNVQSGSPEGDDSHRAKPRLLTCETDCKNMGETIRVISDARKTTVSLDASGPTGGAWLLESERRSAGPGGIVID